MMQVLQGIQFTFFIEISVEIFLISFGALHSGISDKVLTREKKVSPKDKTSLGSKSEMQSQLSSHKIPPGTSVAHSACTEDTDMTLHSTREYMPCPFFMKGYSTPCQSTILA